MQLEDFKWRIQAEQQITTLENKKRAEQQALNYLDLVKQIEANKRIKEEKLV
jgi:hypothetical protein